MTPAIKSTAIRLLVRVLEAAVDEADMFEIVRRWLPVRESVVYRHFHRWRWYVQLGEFSIKPEAQGEVVVVVVFAESRDWKISGVTRQVEALVFASAFFLA